MTSTAPLETSVEEYASQIKVQTDLVLEAANGLPKDIRFHRSLDGKFKKDLDTATARVLRLTNRLLKLVETVSTKPTNGKAQRRRAEDRSREDFEDEQDVIDRFHSGAVDLMDPLFERVDHCLDIHYGKAKSMLPSKTVDAVPQGSTRLPNHLLHAYKLAKPQLQFRDKVNNDENTLWTHKVGQKWHDKGPKSTDDTSGVAPTHPYFHEISTISYPSSLFTSRSPVPPKSFEETPFTFVDTLDGLLDLINGLRASEELAIDLEHHSYRSYYGFVCLMQISNRSRDWIIDCLVPDIRSNMELLNEVFTDPGIIKVFHGAGHDIIWLQENFNIYIVNLFDTYHASRLLEFPKFSLAFLLSKYCGFTADKRYQLADWRIRPLPQEMIHYARSDTHFLLFIYDSLREDLLQIDRSKITDGAPHDYESVKRVLKDSEETSLKEAAWEPYDTLNGEGTKGWAGLVRKTNKPELATPGPSRNVFLAIHRWRDSVAREEDESPLFVLSNQALLSIVEKVPTDLSSLYDLFGNFVPISIRKKGPELLKVIQDASLAAPMVIRDQAETFSGPDTTGKQDTRKKEAESQVTVFSTKPTPTIGLWSSSLSGVTSVPSKPPIAQNSSLFGSVLKSPHPISRNEQGTVASSRSLLTQTSVLLGNRPFVTGGSGPNLGISRTLESITRIHDSILNSQRKAVTFQTTTSRHVGVAVSNKRDTKPQMSTSRPLVPNTQTTPPNQPVPPTEIEFVPRSQRDTIADNDDIVTVGFRKQKRKRPDGESDVEQRKKNRYSRLESFGTNSGSTSNPRDLPVDDVKTFDYDGAPNILDEGMKDLKGERQGRDVSKKERKEARKNQGTKLDFKGFAPAPRKTNEPKSGNKSITYR